MAGGVRMLDAPKPRECLCARSEMTYSKSGTRSQVWRDRGGVKVHDRETACRQSCPQTCGCELVDMHLGLQRGPRAAHSGCDCAAGVRHLDRQNAAVGECVRGLSQV